MSNLIQKKCKPCEGGVEPLSIAQAEELRKQTPEWQITQNPMKIERTFVFKNFAQALQFVNKGGQIAESEDHHPDLNLHSYKKVTVTLWTHAIGGLSENDFIVAAKIDALSSMC